MTNQIAKKLRSLASLALLLAFSSVLVNSARAVNLSDAELARFLENENYRRIEATGTAVGGDQFALNLTYIGSSTGAVISITQTALTFYAPWGTADTTIGASGIVDLSAAPNNTFGGLCDTINASAGYRCTLLDGRRADNTTLLDDQTGSSAATNLKQGGGYNVYFDTGGASAVDNIGFFSLGITPLAGKRVVLKSCKFNYKSGASGAASPGLAALTVSGQLRKDENSSDGAERRDAVVFYKTTTSSNTDTTVVFDGASGGSGGVGGIQFAQGAQSSIPGPSGTGDTYRASNPGHVVVRIDPNTSNIAPQGTYTGATGVTGLPNFLECAWESR